MSPRRVDRADPDSGREFVEALLTTYEARLLLNLSVSGFERVVNDGRLPVVMFGRKTRRFRLSDVNALIEKSLEVREPAGRRARAKKTAGQGRREKS